MNKIAEKLLDLRENGFSLQETLQKIVPCLRDNFDDVAWKSLDINYHPPRVERLWTQIDTMRLMVHRIHPTVGTPSDEESLFHPHPWPSAVYIVTGQYEMEVGYGETAQPPPVAAKVAMVAGACYEMTDKNGWHSVSPRGFPSISIMLTDTPWKEPHPFYLSDTYEKMKLGPLTEKDRKKVVAGLLIGLRDLDL